MERMSKIMTAFPDFSGLSEFYREMVIALCDLDEIKHSLGAVRWANKNINIFSTKYSEKIRKCKDMNVISRYKKEYYGRISSVLKQISKALLFLDDARRNLRQLPKIDEELFTVTLFGFPNIGKSTLLSKLTTSKPDIKPYAFTTKGLNLGFLEHKHCKIQIIDCPGTLNRFNTMNAIEKVAYLAVSHLADLVIYVYDLTEPYSLDEQKKLRKVINKPTILYLSKTDLLLKQDVNEFLGKNAGFIDLELLKQKIFEEADKKKFTKKED